MERVFKSEIASLKNKISGLQDELTAKTNEASELQQDNVKLSGQITVLSNTNQDQRNFLAEKDSIIENLNSEINGAEDQIKELTEKSQDAEERLRNAQVDVSPTKAVKLSVIKRENKDLAFRNESLRSEVNELTVRNSSFEAEIKFLKMKNKTSEEEIEMLIKKNSQFQKEIEKLKSNNLASEAEVMNISTRNFESKEEIDNLASKYKTAEQEVKKLTYLNSKATKEIEYLKNKVRIVEKESKNIRSQFNLSPLKRRKSSSCSDVDPKIESLTSSLENAKLKIEDCNEQIKRLKLKSEQMNAENELLQLKVDKVKSEKNELEKQLAIESMTKNTPEPFTSGVFEDLKKEHKVIVDLHRVEVNKKENEINKLMARNSEVECELIELKSSNDIRKSESKYLSTKVSTLENELKGLKEKHQRAARRFNELKNSYDQSYVSNLVKEHNFKVNEKDAVIRDLKAEMDRYEGEKGELLAKSGEVKLQAERMMDANLKLKQETEELNERINAYENKVVLLSQQLQTREAVVDSLTLSEKNNMTKVEELSAELKYERKSLDAQSAEAKSKIDHLQKNIKTLERVNKDFKDKNGSLASEVKALNEEKVVCDDQIKKLTSKLKYCKSKLANTDKENSISVERLIKLDEEVKVKNNLIKRYEDEINSKNEEIKNLTEQNGNDENEKEKIATLKSEINYLKSKISALENENAEVTEDSLKAATEIKTLKVELDQASTRNEQLTKEHNDKMNEKISEIDELDIKCGFQEAEIAQLRDDMRRREERSRERWEDVESKMRHKEEVQKSLAGKIQEQQHQIETMTEEKSWCFCEFFVHVLSL